MDDPFVRIMDPLRTLRLRIEETFAEHGLHVTHVGFVPGTDTEGPHEVQVLARLADERPESDESFRRVLREAHEAETNQKATQALDELRDQLRGGKGFLGPPQEETD